MSTKEEQLALALGYIYFGDGFLSPEMMLNKRLLIFHNGELKIQFLNNKVYMRFSLRRSYYREIARLYDYDMNLIKEWKTSCFTNHPYSSMIDYKSDEIITRQNEEGIVLISPDGTKLESGIYIDRSVFEVFPDLPVCNPNKHKSLNTVES